MAWQKDNGTICFNDPEQISKELKELLEETELTSKEVVEKEIKKFFGMEEHKRRRT